MPDSLRDHVMRQRGALHSMRAPALDRARRTRDAICPSAGLFPGEEDDARGYSRPELLDNTAQQYMDVLSSGMLAGVSSPARPWIKYRTADPDLRTRREVSEYLEAASELALTICAEAGVYTTLRSAYEELAWAGTTHLTLDDDFDTVVSVRNTPFGTFSIGQSAREKVDTVYRDLRLTVAQTVREFGLAACSRTVRNAFDSGDYLRSVAIVHGVEPRAPAEAYQHKGTSKGFSFRSIYCEAGESENKVLRESGFETFPGLAPRWKIRPGHTYGESPGMVATGDACELELLQQRKRMLRDLRIRPPLQVPVDYAGQEQKLLPGGMVFVDRIGPHNTASPIWSPTMGPDELMGDLADIRARIRDAFKVDLFMMLLSTQGAMTATEVAARQEEKLVLLGPVIERLHSELLSPLAVFIFERVMSLGILGPPPQELIGRPIEVEFVSLLAQAQKYVSAGPLDRFVATIGSIAQLKPQALDMLDEYGAVQAYAELLGVPASAVVPMKDAVFLRQQQMQAQAEEAQAARAAQDAATAQRLANTSTGQGSVLAQLMEQGTRPPL